MADAADQGARKSGGGVFAVARRVDDVVFAVEKAIVALALITITVVVFVDVIARRINAPDSKIGQLISKFGGIDDFETKEWIDANVAPWVTLVLSLLLLGFGMYSGRRFVRLRSESKVDVQLGKEIGIAVGFAVAAVAAAWGFAQVFEQLESWMVYAGTFGLSALVFAGYSAYRKKDDWIVHTVASLVVGAILVWVAVEYVPIGYTWSKKVSLLLLLWVGLLSASICVYAGKHIRMGAAQKLLPEKARPYLNGTGFLATAVFCGLMTFLGFMYVFAPTVSDDEFMTEIMVVGGERWVYGFEGMVGRGGYLEGTDIPDWLGILAAPVGFGIATIRFTGAAISAFLGGSYGESAAEEGLEEAKSMTAGGEETLEEAREEARDEAAETAPAPAPEEEE